MRYFTLHRILALSNLFVLAILFSDTYILPPRTQREIYADISSYETRTSTWRHHSSFFITAASGHQFQIPAEREHIDLNLLPGDTFYAQVSPVLRRPEMVYYSIHNDHYAFDMGILKNFWGRLLSAYILAVSLLTLLPWRFSRSDTLNERLIFSGSALLAVLLFFYFYQ